MGAASETYSKESGKYNLDFKKPPAEMAIDRLKTGDELGEHWAEMAAKYPVALLEDPCDENDFLSHAKLTAKIGASVEIVGDDLYCTNPKLVAKGIENKSTNAMLLKVNQIAITDTGMTHALALPTSR